MSQQGDQKTGDHPEHNVFILYIPGGAMFGLLPALMLDHLEKLTDTPANELFQVMEGVSAGSIIVAAMNTPDISASDSLDFFCIKGPQFFPEVPMRGFKMISANILNVIKDNMQIDPLRSDYSKIRKLNTLCDKLEESVSAEGDRKTVEKIRKLSTKRWLTRKTHKKILELCRTLRQSNPDCKDTTHYIADLLTARKHTNRLSIPFKSAALGAINAVTPKNYMLDPKILEDFFKDLFGDRDLEHTQRSTYISAFDIKNNKIVTFSSRKADFTDPNSESEEENNNVKLWDAIMASTANPFAFPPHITENGIICSDKAIIHAPQSSVDDVLQHKADNVNVKLIILGTGRYISEDMEDDFLKDQYAEYGVAGNLVSGRELSELENYALSQAIRSYRKKLGDENVIELNPRLTPLTPEEKENFPGSPLDAGEKNVESLLSHGQKYIDRNRQEIGTLAKDLIDNLYNLGQIDEHKYQKISDRLDDYLNGQYKVPVYKPPKCQTGLIEQCQKAFQSVSRALTGQPDCPSQSSDKPKKNKRGGKKPPSGPSP